MRCVDLELYLVVFCDGKPCVNVLMADEEAGVLQRYRTDEFGNAVFTKDGEPILETLYGVVRVIPTQFGHA